MLLNRLTERSRIDGRIVLTEVEEEKIITEALEENGIVVRYTDHKKLRSCTIKVEALFECGYCGKAWSSHMGTVVVDLVRCKPNKFGCRQRCKKCPEGWTFPKFTEDRFKEAIVRVISKYWERKNQNDDDIASTLADDDNYRGNPQAPHEQSLCERCMKLGRPCW